MIDETVIAVLRASLSDDGTVIGQLIELYTKDTPQLIADAAAALEKGDIATLTRAAHSLKSTSASMGATTVTELARELELHAKQSDLAKASAVLERLRPEVRGTIADLAKLKF